MPGSMPLSEAKNHINSFLTEKKDKTLGEAIVVLMKFYKDSLNDLSGEVKQLEADREALEHKVESKQTALMDWKEKYDTMKKTKTEEIERLKQSNFEMYAKSKEQDNDLAILRDQAASKDDQIKKLKELINENDKNFLANASMMDELAVVKNEVSKLKQENKVYEEENRILQSKFDAQEETLRELRNSLDEAEKSKEKEIKHATDKLKEEIHQYKDLISQYMFKIRELEIANKFASMEELAPVNRAPVVHQQTASNGNNGGYEGYKPTQNHLQNPRVDVETFNDPPVQPPQYDYDHMKNQPHTPYNDKQSEASNKAQRNPVKSIMSFPAYDHLELNKLTIEKLNELLNKLLFKKAELDGQLCKVPEAPKRIADKEKKQKLEDDLAALKSEISTVKKKLKEFGCL